MLYNIGQILYFQSHASAKYKNFLCNVRFYFYFCLHETNAKSLPYQWFSNYILAHIDDTKYFNLNVMLDTV